MFPDDLGEFSEYPGTTIANINNNKAYGISTWRVPTDEELRMLIQNAEKIGLRKVSTKLIRRYTGSPYEPGEPDYMYWYKSNAGSYIGTFEFQGRFFYLDGHQMITTERVMRLVSSGK